MRVDTHQHFWRYDAREHGWIDDSMTPLRRDFLPEDVLPEMRRAQVEASIAVQARQSLEETWWLLSLSERHGFIAGVVGWIDLRAPDVEEVLARISDHPRLVGVRHIVQAEPDDAFLLTADFCRGIGRLRGFGLSYDILIYPRHLTAAAEFVSRFPGQPFVLDHAAKPDIRSGEIRTWARDLRRLAESPDVYCKASGLVTEADWRHWTPAAMRPYLDVVFDCFGPSRVMAGSDWPVCTLAAGYGPTIGLLDEYLADRPAAEREAVMGGNALRFWNIPAGEVA